EVLGHWDFARDVTSTRVVDVTSHKNHGTAVNFPARAVTGPTWADSPARVFTDTPSAYAAIHFHDDDLDDAGWEPSVAINVPPDARTGLYAASLEIEHDRLFVPFVVRPRKREAELALLLPTLTWQAYS